MMDVRSAVLSEFQQVASEHRKELAPLDDELLLLNTGLDSLCIAVVVARLEDALGYDPFVIGDDMTFPVTVGDFIRLYEKHAA
jgi:acyl carrier protein